jgi:maleate cis-trans isomerase
MLGWRGMVGLIVPSNNNVVLPELYSALPDGVTAYETRMRVEGDLTFEALRKMTGDAEAAAELLRQTGVDFICYCCRASTIVKGWEWERGCSRDFPIRRERASPPRIPLSRMH